MVLGTCASFMVAGRLSADTVELRPVADTSLMEVSPDNSNGGQAWLLAGTTQNFPKMRAVMQFDYAGLIPPDAIINAVQLLLEVTRQPRDGYNPAPFGLHRMLRAWGEGTNIALDNPGGMGAPAATNDATWNERFAHTGQTWGAPGGAAGVDFVTEASSQTFIYGVGNSPYTFSSSLDPQLVGDVQDWLANPASNFGWMLLGEAEDINFTARRFASREAPNDLGPRLFIDYTTVPEPGTLALGALGLGGLSICLRGRKKLSTSPWC